MGRIKALGRYQKTILLLLLIMVIAFTVLYAMTTSKDGYPYLGAVLLQSKGQDTTQYSGSIEGKPATFSVTKDQTITFQYDNKVYGPYAVKEDPTAIPVGNSFRKNMIGMELLCGEEVIFRGGGWKQDGFWWLINEDGESVDSGTVRVFSDHIVTDENGNIIDQAEPALSDILNLMYGPPLTHKGSWLLWLLGVFICFITAITIAFADALFRFGLAFKIQNAAEAEPSDFVIMSRYISWTVLPIFALIVFIQGLQ